MASEVLLTISKDEHERARLLSEEKYELDMQSKFAYARHEGLLEGEQKGVRQGKQEILDLLKNGVSSEEIIRDYQ